MPLIRAATARERFFPRICLNNPMSPMPSVRVNRKAADRIHSGHLWIFASDVIDASAAQPGDAVRVLTGKAQVLGTAHYSSTSQIALRLLSRHTEPIDENFFRKRLEAACQYRKRVVRDSDAYRLVHAEGDLLPGLIVDHYADFLVIQLLDQGMDRIAAQVITALTNLFHPKAIVARNDIPVRLKENLPQQAG